MEFERAAVKLCKLARDGKTKAVAGSAFIEPRTRTQRLRDLLGAQPWSVIVDRDRHGAAILGTRLNDDP